MSPVLRIHEIYACVQGIQILRVELRHFIMAYLDQSNDYETCVLKKCPQVYRRGSFEQAKTRRRSRSSWVIDLGYESLWRTKRVIMCQPCSAHATIHNDIISIFTAKLWSGVQHTTRTLPNNSQQRYLNQDFMAGIEIKMWKTLALSRAAVRRLKNHPAENVLREILWTWPPRTSVSFSS